MSGFYAEDDDELAQEGGTQTGPGAWLLPPEARKPRKEMERGLVPGEADAVLQVALPLKPDEWAPVFLRVYGSTGNVQAGLNAAQITRATFKEHLEASPKFKSAYEDARDEAIESLELEAWRRARNGSDFLLWRLMQALRPEVYGEKRTIEHKFSQSERREAYRLAKQNGLNDVEAREAVAAAEEMLRQGRGRGS